MTYSTEHTLQGNEDDLNICQSVCQGGPKLPVRFRALGGASQQGYYYMVAGCGQPMTGVLPRCREITGPEDSEQTIETGE